jgi:hypothetical protein
LISADQIRKAGWDMKGNKQKYFTWQEFENLKGAEQKRVEGDGMKRGGKVSISNNPDTMMLAVNNVKMQAGGLAKLLRAVPKSKAEIEAIAQRMAPQMLGEFVRGDAGTQSVASKTQKQFAKEKEMVHDIRPTGAQRPLPKTVDIEDMKDQVMIGIAGDPTISGQTLHSLNGIPLDSPSPQHGGPLYGLGRDEEFWASGLGAANRVQNLAREAGKQYDMPVLGKYIMMGPESINYAQHYADANLSAINPAKMSKGQVESFNKLIREGYPYTKNKERYQRVFPAFPGIENPSEAYLHFSIDPELRKHFNALMQMPTVTEKYALPSGIDVRHAITEPDLRDLETGVTGKSIGRMRPEVTNLKLSEHPTYSHDIPGEFMGSSQYPIPYELSFPDTVKAIRENPKQAPHEFGSLKMIGPRQVIDQQMIDEIKQYQEQIKRLTGKKKGGAVKKQVGGAIKSLAKAEGLAKLAKMREEMTPRADAVKNLIARDENKYLRDVVPNSLTNAEIEAEIKRMAAKAPMIMKPSALTELRKTVQQEKGDYGSRRVERAADEIPNLDKLYKEEALKRAFTGDNAQALMTMNPADFENYAARLAERSVSEPKSFGDKMRLSTEDYLKYLNSVNQFDDVPFLVINKQEQGLPLTPFISGHEGRHRNRAMAHRGEQSGLVQLLPRAELREPFPRRSQEEYIDALRQEMEMTGNKVKPESYFDNSLPKNLYIERPAIDLPDFYAKGGAAKPKVKAVANGEVKMTTNRDTMFMELSNKKLKRK